MKLGIVADEIDRDFGRALRIGTSLGLRRYEIRYLKSGRAPICDRQELLEVERQAKDEGVEITALSPGLFKQVGDEAGFRREMNEVYPRCLEWAMRWKLPGLIVFGFHKPGTTEGNADLVSSKNPPQEVRDWIRRVGEQALEDDIHLIIEPEPVCWADTWKTTADLIRCAGLPSLKINDDPGNVAWMERQDSTEEFRSVVSWVENVHVKDLRWAPRGSGKPQFVPVGEGMIDYRSHFLLLQQAKYEGPISLEPHMDGDARTIRRCAQAFESLWNCADSR